MSDRTFRPPWVRPVRRAPRFVQDTVAITPVIGTIMILGVSAIGIGAVMAWGVPSLQDTKANTEYAGLQEQFATFDAVATNVMHGGSPGKASMVNANLAGGQIARTQGDWFMVEWYPVNTAGPNGKHHNASFEVTGYDDPTPTQLNITNREVKLTDPKFTYETVYDKTHVNRLTVPGETYEFDDGWAQDESKSFLIGDTEEFKTYPTRLRITDISADEVLAEIWIFPMGALEYTRETETQGPIKVVLENAAVLTQRTSAAAIRDKPMVTKEDWASPAGEPKLVVLFMTVYTDDPEDPGVTAAGAGSWPLLFSLKSNNLRANSTEVVSSSITVSGSRAPTWLQYYIDHYDYVREGTSNTVTLDAGPTKDTYTFVLMETLMEISLHAEGADITPRPPPPPPGSGTNPGNNGGNNGPCRGPVVKACGWNPTGSGFQAK